MTRRRTATSKKAADTTSSQVDACLDDIVHTLARIAAREVQDSIAPVAPSRAQSRPPRQTRSSRRKSKPSAATTAPDLLAMPTDDEAAATVGQQRPLTLHEIAGFLAISDGVARYLLRTKKLRGFKAGGQWRAMPQDVAEYVTKQLSKT